MDRRKILLVFGVIIAIVGGGLVFMYAQSADARANAKFDAVQVVVATQPIPQGTSAATAKTTNLLGLETITSNAVVPGVLTSLDQVKDTDIAAMTMSPGEQVLATKFIAPASVSQLPIPKGDVAISLSFDDPGRVAGYITPGNKVVVFATLNQNTRLLMSNALVIGVGGTTSAPQVVPAGTTAPTNGAASAPATLLTFAVPQADAEKLILMSKTAGLTLALRDKQSKVAKDSGATLSNAFN